MAPSNVDNGPGHVRISTLIYGYRVAAREPKQFSYRRRIDEIIYVDSPAHTSDLRPIGAT